MEYKIKKAKIKGMTLETEMEEIIHIDGIAPITNDITKKSDQLIHPDLQKSFDDLRPHLIMICDQKEDSSVIRIMQSAENEIAPDEIDLRAIDLYNVTGFVIGGEDRDGVTLIGQKSLDTKVLNLIAPFTKYAEYNYGSELSLAVEACIHEVEQYLFNGKCAVKQMELPFDEQQDPEYNVSMVVTGPDGKSVETDTKTLDKAAKRLKERAEA